MDDVDGRPVVEMLWESCDAHDVLLDRFGFTGPEAAADWVLTVLQEHWAVEDAVCDRIVISDANALAWVTTSSGGLLVKWSVAPTRFERLARVAALTTWLDDRGLPVSAPLPSSDGPSQVECDGVSLSLQRVVAGDLLDVDDLAQVRAAGAALARMHDALSTYPHEVAVPDEHPAPLRDRVEQWLDSPGDQVPTSVRDALRADLAALPDVALPVQLVHGDFRSSNVLCQGSTVAAVIDLEETRPDHCVVEVARSAVMLGTRFRDWGPVSAQVRATFVSAYLDVRPWTPAEAAWWDVVLVWQAWAMVPRGDDPTGWGRAAHDVVSELTGRGANGCVAAQECDRRNGEPSRSLG